MTEDLVVLTLQAPVLQDGDVLAQATDLAITGIETQELAIELREGIRALIAEIDGGYRPHIQRAHELHAGLCAELRERTALPKQALALVNGKLADYETQRRLAAEAEARARWAQQQREAEWRRDQEALAAGTQEAAQLVRETPLEAFVAPVVTPPTVAPKGKGVAVTLSYQAELTDLAALAAFAVANPALLALCLAPNQAGLDALVKQQGESFAIPGVKRVAKAPVVRSTRR
jgi:hypothetical protein